MKIDDPRLPERFWMKVVPEPMTGCWLWTGVQNRSRGYGYGSIWRGNRKVYAHRWAYEALVGPIPPGREVDHRCRQRLCVNPGHLEAVEHAENIRRSPVIAREFARSADVQRVKTHCPQGHAYEGENLYVNPTTGRRSCRTCQRAALRDYYGRNAEKMREQSREYHRANRERRNAEARAAYHSKRKPPKGGQS